MNEHAYVPLPGESHPGLPSEVIEDVKNTSLRMPYISTIATVKPIPLRDFSLITNPDSIVLTSWVWRRHKYIVIADNGTSLSYWVWKDNTGRYIAEDIHAQL